MADYERRLTGNNSSDSINQLRVELDNIRAAWRWAVSHAKLDWLAQSLRGLVQLYTMLGL